MSMRNRFQGKSPAAALAGLALTTAAPLVAVAGPLPAATADIHGYLGLTPYDYGSVSIPSTITSVGPHGDTISSVSINGPDGPSVSVVAGPYNTSYASLTYYYEVNGPAGQMVPVDLTGILQTSSAEPYLLSNALAQISGSIASGHAAACIGNFSFCEIYSALYPSVNVDMVLQVPSDTVESLTLFAYGVGEYADFGAAQYSYTASVDPLLTIDPSAGGGYSIAVSPGVYNGAVAPAGGVPEPAIWALMLLGFGGLGARLRRHRARACAIAKSASIAV